MKKYTAKDIKVHKWDELIKKRPEMYFGEGGPTPLKIIDAFDYVAKTLGASKTYNTHLDDWWYFCSDIDWVFKSEIKINSIKEVFFGWKTLPEGDSPNSYRCEVVCTPFSSDIYSLVNNEIEVIKGSAPDQKLISTHLNNLGEWGRIVGFKFEENS